MLGQNSSNDNSALMASGYCGRLKIYCRQFVTQDYYSRALVFHNMLLECEKFKIFLQEYFKANYPQLESAVLRIEDEINALRKINSATKKGHCNVCNAPLVTFNTLISECPTMTMCNNCPKKINAYVNDLECATGVDWL